MGMLLVLVACATTSVTSSSASAVALTPEETAQAVRSVVQRQSGQVRYCYESRLKERPQLAGDMVITFVVSAGRVTESSVAQNTTGDEALAACVLSRVSAWRFGERVSGELSYPFTLSPAGTRGGVGE